MKDSSSHKKRLLFVVPLPPPYAGPEVSSELLLRSPLKERFEIQTVRSNVHRSNSERGRITLASTVSFLSILVRVIGCLLLRKPAVVYTILNQNVSGFIRDSLLVLASKSFGKKVVLHFRGSTFDSFYQARGVIFKRYVEWILRTSDAVIVQAERIKARLKGIVPDDRMRVVFNGIDADGVAVKHSNGQDGAKEGITVLYLNHLSVAKGALVLLEAVKATLEARNDIHFVIAGDMIPQERNIFRDEAGNEIPMGDIGAAISSMRKHGRFGRHVRFMGEVRDQSLKESILRGSDIFVLTSYSEGCPMSVLEAMKAGLPVVATGVGALPEMIKDGENGFLVRSGCPEELTEKIAVLADDAALREAMGGRNQRLTRSRFHIDRIAEELGEILDSV